ncbi:MAG: hypothetical protein IKQ89_02725, partial [Muribaculaceae bacterium]|nr:hypothetical protein [Muribaculaceae bacterium]
KHLKKNFHYYRVFNDFSTMALSPPSVKPLGLRWPFTPTTFFSLPPDDEKRGPRDPLLYDAWHQLTLFGINCPG